MHLQTDFVKIIEVATVATMLLICSATVIAQQQPPAVSRPTASSVQVSPQSGPSPYSSAANTATGMKPALGSVTGFVYWQMNVLQPQSTCQGLTVKVATVTKSGLPLQLLSTTSTFTAMGPVTDYSAQGAPKYMLCSYAFHNMPENVFLRALLYGPSTASVSIPSAFQILGGNCNSTPSSSLSFILTGGEMPCGDNAFNINFKLTPTAGAASPRPTAPSILLPHAPPSAGLLSKAQDAPAAATLLTPAPTGGATLLSAKPGTAAGNASSTPGSNETLLPAAKSANGASIGGSGGFTGGVKPANGNLGFSDSANPTANNLSTPVLTGNFVPKMPPIKSNPKRDAAPPADSAAIAQIRSKLEVQLAASRQHTATLQNVTPKESKSPEIQALHEQKIFVDSLRNQGGPAKDRLVAARAPSSILPGQKPAASDPKLIAPPPLTTMCAGPQIRSVNGATSGVIFTQDPQYNDYIIRGCGFGNQQGQTYLSGALTGGRINLVVKQWTDTQIEAVVQPGLTGVLDGWPDLIVAPASGSPAKFHNCRFYAQRKSVLLNSIPRQYANLANVTVGDSTHGFGTMYCPGPDVSHLFPCVAYNAGPPLDGISNGHDHKNDPSRAVSNAVDRDGGQDQFNSGEDVYDLSSMAPGFEIDDSSVDWYAWTMDVCEGWASDAFPKKPGDSVGYDTEGHYSWSTKTKTKIVVDWGVDHCGWRWLGMFKVDDWYNSGYSLEVYVKGPIGVDPWTGHPVSVVHNFGEEQQSRTLQVR
jgi:hypothetical protein